MQSSSSAGATDPWAEEESHAPALSAMVSSSDPTQHDDDNGDNDEDNDKDDDKDADKEEEEEDEPASTEDSDHLAPPTSELHTLNLSSAPASSNPWAESLPADPLAPSSTTPTSRPTDPLRTLSSSTSITGGIGPATTAEHDPTPSSTTYAREWAEYDAAHFGVGLEKLGQACARYWSFKARYTNLNAGAFGACPNVVCQAYKEIQDEIEACPDYFIDSVLPKRLLASRERIAPLLNVSPDDIAFVPNTTTAFHSVIRDLPHTIFEPSDAILTLSTIYGAIGLNVQYLLDSNTGKQAGYRKVEVPLRWPLRDEEILKAVEEVILRDRSEEALAQRNGKGKIRLAVFDAISSMPGVRLPWEKLVALAKKHGIITFIDGAHAIGQIQLDIGSADPDFFVSNCHKWLYAHRGCAVFYVAKRNQHAVQGVPISWMYIPAAQRAEADKAAVEGALPTNSWRVQWESSGTVDWSSLMTVDTALDFRQKLGGERRIMAYTHWVALRGGQLAAKILGTEMLEVLDDVTLAAVTNDPDQPSTTNEDKGENASTTAISTTESSKSSSSLPQRQRPHTMSLVNLRLPLTSAVFSPAHPAERKAKLKAYFFRTLWDEFRTAIPVYEHGDRMWARMAGSVFLDVGDLEFGAKALRDVCRRLNEGVDQV
ncbi:hypothetical protein CF328_g1308 [Tilletia controversa]|nr:hypothetical protein CF328_g1308 [Tilletia controversa]